MPNNSYEERQQLIINVSVISATIGFILSYLTIAAGFARKFYIKTLEQPFDPAINNISQQNPIADFFSTNNLKLNIMQIPEAFICPTSKKLMLDPVIAPNGETYDRSSAPQDTEVIINWNMRKQILDFLDKTVKARNAPVIHPNTTSEIPSQTYTYDTGRARNHQQGISNSLGVRAAAPIVRTSMRMLGRFAPY